MDYHHSPLAPGTRQRALRSRGCVSNTRRAALRQDTNTTSCWRRSGSVRPAFLAHLLRGFPSQSQSVAPVWAPNRTAAESAAPGAAFEAAWGGLSEAAAFCSDPAVSWRRFHNRLAFLLAPSPLQLLSTLIQAVFSLRLAATRRPAGPGSRAAGKIGRVRSR